MPEFFGWLATEGRAIGSAILAGAAGGVFRSLALRQTGKGDFAINTSAGILSGIYLGPPVANTIAPYVGGVGVHGANVLSLGGFIAGAVGITLVGLALDFGRKKVNSYLDKDDNKGK